MDRVIATYSNTLASNCYQRREGYTLTPLMQRKIQYGKMKKKDNMDAVKNEFETRLVGYKRSTGCRKLISLLKKTEKKINADAQEKCSLPVIEYINFRWNDNN